MRRRHYSQIPILYYGHIKYTFDYIWCNTAIYPQILVFIQFLSYKMLLTFNQKYSTISAEMKNLRIFRKSTSEVNDHDSQITYIVSRLHHMSCCADFLCFCVKLQCCIGWVLRSRRHFFPMILMLIR